MSSGFEKLLASIGSSVEKERPEARSRRIATASRHLLSDLAKAGYEVKTLAELRNGERAWETAVPILLNWLPRVKDPDVKEEIVRSLSVPWVGRRATATLIEDFKASAEHGSLGWAIGNALSIVDVTGFESEIIALVTNPKYGTARQMLVLALGKFRGKNAEDVAISALGEDELVLHAIEALSKMRSVRSIPMLQSLLSHKRGAVRKNARKALTKIAATRTGGWKIDKENQKPA